MAMSLTPVVLGPPSSGRHCADGRNGAPKVGDAGRRGNLHRPALVRLAMRSVYGRAIRKGPAPAQQILSHLQGVKQSGDQGWQAKCPAHDDGTASLSCVGNFMTR